MVEDNGNSSTGCKLAIQKIDHQQFHDSVVMERPLEGKRQQNSSTETTKISSNSKSAKEIKGQDLRLQGTTKNLQTNLLHRKFAEESIFSLDQRMPENTLHISTQDKFETQCDGYS
jgi:hypothetical protein